MTSIATVEYDKLRVDVISPKNDSKEIEEIALFALPVDFKFNSKEQEDWYCDKSQIYIKSNDGNKYMGFEGKNIALLGKEYYFNVGKTPDSEYTLIIPKVLLKYNSNTECIIDLTMAGEEPLNKIVNISGFPVNLSVARIDENNIKIQVDVNYNVSYYYS